MNHFRHKKPDGYKELLVYKRAQELQRFVYKITTFPLIERRRREHMRDSARSVKQNIVEGWKRETTQEYINFLSFSFGSLGELKEDGEDCLERGLIKKEEFDELTKKCGEEDFLLGRLKNALEKKIEKQEVLSPYERWLGGKIKKEKEENKKYDQKLKEILRKEGKIFTRDGVMDIEEAKRRGLEEIDIP